KSSTHRFVFASKLGYRQLPPANAERFVLALEMANVVFEDDDDDVSFCSDSDIDEALDSKKDDDEYIKGSFSSSWRPNAHGGHHSYSSVLKPRYHKFSRQQIRASPLEEWEGGVNIAMSNTVTTAIRSSVRGMSIGKTRITDKADRATVENVCKK
ncbi:serine/threonine-protein kinase rio1-like, partial [Trifolium medium]|nr:serine/threonine-protein kinase rio1-like [Trifolium medium]